MLNQIVPGSVEDFQKNQLRVITFNFDRSFERRLFIALKAIFNLNEEDAATLTASVPVVHIHGELGTPAWIRPHDGETCRPYTYTATAEQLRRAAGGIRVIHEELRKERLEQACNWLEWAHVIGFIGLGFHRINLARLQTDRIMCDLKIVRLTAFGFTEAELERVKKSFDGKIHVYPHLDALNFLRNTDILHHSS